MSQKMYFNNKKMNCFTVVFILLCTTLKVGQANPVIKAHLARNQQLNVPYQIPQKTPHHQLLLDDFSQLSEEQIEKAIKDVRITINEVQKRLASDPNLPRLTKGEIEELFENVTREELQRSIHLGDRRREKHMRALMLVLPYHANDVMTPEKIQQLYTKKPITQLMNNKNNGQQITLESANMPAFRPLAPKPTVKTTTTTSEPITAVPSMQRYPPMPVEPFGLRDSVIPEKGYPGPFSTPTDPPPSPLPVFINGKSKKKVPSQQLTIAQRGKVNVASISITKAPYYTTTTKKPTRNPQSVFEILQAIGLHQEKVKASHMATSTSTTTTTTTPEPPSTTTEMSEEMKRLLLEFGIYQQEKNYQQQQILQQEQQILQQQGQIYQDQGQIYQNQGQIYQQQGQTLPEQHQPIADVPFVSDIQYEPPYSFSVQNPGFGVDVNNFRPLPLPYESPVYPGYTILETGDESRASGSQKVQVSVKAPESVIETTSAPTTTTKTTVSTTSTTTTTPKPKITKPKVNKPTDFTNFKPLPTDSTKLISEDFQNILRQFGLLGGNPSPTKTRIPKKHKTEGTTTTTSTTTSTTEAPMKTMPDIINIPLPNDMMEILANLGISTESPMGIKVQMPSKSSSTRTTRVSKRTTVSETSSITTPSSAIADTDSNAEVIKTTSAQASGFARRSEIKTTPVSTKSTSKSSMRPIVVAEIPMEKPRKIDSYSKTNIFKPTSSAKQTSKDDYRKLEHLLETIKELDKLNTSLTAKQLDSLDLNNFNFSDSLLSQQGPDPLNYYETHPFKNEIKRQEPSDEKEDNPTKISLDLNESDSPKIMVVNAVKASKDLEEEGTTFKPLNQITDEKDDIKDSNDDDDGDKDKDDTKDDSTITTTTEEGRSASADDLKDSFPNDTDPDEPIDESLPLPRRNGFYFLADWNSFLEVGQDEEKVVVRFDPKIGDPSRFLPVHIPSKTT